LWSEKREDFARLFGVSRKKTKKKEEKITEKHMAKRRTRSNVSSSNLPKIHQGGRVRRGVGRLSSCIKTIRGGAAREKFLPAIH